MAKLTEREQVALYCYGGGTGPRVVG